MLEDIEEKDRGLFLINLLGIVYNPNLKKIIIGEREKDPYIEKLSWVFPGGRPGYDEDLENYLEKEIKKKTGLDVEVKKIIFAKTYPERRDFLSIYYFCTTDQDNETPSEKFARVKWINPTEVRRYFTTSLHPALFEKLEELERTGEIK